MTTTLETLCAARALIERPERWTQGEYARDRRGDGLLPYAPDAVCWCAVGAVRKLGSCVEDYYVWAALSAHLPRDMLLSEFNDTHTHTEVLALFDAAIAAEEAKEKTA